jgi:hypothetical protein
MQKVVNLTRFAYLDLEVGKSYGDMAQLSIWALLEN